MAIIIEDHLHGVDVSRYQDPWTPDPNDDFYILKATGGHATTGGWNHIDPTLEKKRTLVRATSKPVGYYHFLWPSANSVSPEIQAKHFVDAANPVPGEFLVCDWEGVKINANDPSIVVTPTQSDKDRFIAEVQRLTADNKVGMYCNASAWTNSNKNCGDFLWVAAWRADPGIIDDWLFWQYTNTPIDQNISRYKTPEELRRFLAPSSSLPPVPDRLYDLALQNNEFLRQILKRPNTSGGYGY